MLAQPSNNKKFPEKEAHFLRYLPQNRLLYTLWHLNYIKVTKNDHVNRELNVEERLEEAELDELVKTPTFDPLQNDFDQNHPRLTHRDRKQPSYRPNKSGAGTRLIAMIKSM